MTWTQVTGHIVQGNDMDGYDMHLYASMSLPCTSVTCDLRCMSLADFTALWKVDCQNDTPIPLQIWACDGNSDSLYLLCMQ